MKEQLGRYVRVEGCDGAGKTTQIGLLKQFSEEKGIDAVFLREPGATVFGAKIRSLLLDKQEADPSAKTEFLLFTADRNFTCDEVIMPALAEDKLVISDRGLESTLCYQSAAGGVGKEVIMDISRQILPPRYIQPDALALISVTKEVRRRRLGERFEHTAADRMESKEESYADRVYEAYQALSELDYATVINGNLDPEQVFDELKPVVFGKYMKDRSGVFLPTYTNYDDTNATTPAIDKLSSGQK